VRRLSLVLLLAVVLGACKGADDVEPGFVPKTYAFQGEVDKKFAGTWVSTDGISTLDLGEDGNLKIQTLTPSPSGATKSNLEGKWLVSDGSLLMQYGASGKESTVLKYSSTLSQNELKLKQEGGRRETTYRRK
jgi:hypothetical protein